MRLTFSLSVGALLLLSHQTFAGFKILCLTNIIERIDPIIAPGAVSQHVHIVSGANTINFTTAGSDYATLMRAPCTSCIVKEDKSLYWAPALYYRAQNGSFIRVPIDGDTAPDRNSGGGGQRGGITIYYLDRVNPNDTMEAFPPGFRMIAGNPFQRSPLPQYNNVYGNATSFQCIGTNGTSDNRNFYELPYATCSGGIRAQIHFPHCWNGANDSSDHQSHVAYPVDGVEGVKCPSTHPRLLPHLFYEIGFNAPNFPQAFPWYNSSQPFVLAQGDSTGYGLHADFVNGWNTTLLASNINNCGRNQAVDAASCPGFTIAAPNTNEQLACEVAPQVKEDVNGPMSLLPGCNPIQPGPATATVVPGCTRTGTIGPAQTYYSDQTKTFGYSYIGCGNDTNGGYNQFGWNNFDYGGLTVEECIGWVNQRGYTYGAINGNGVCLGGNSGNYANRFPQPGILGNCDQPCRGNSSEFCGGFYALSYYKRCAQNGTSCVNNPSA